MCEHFVHGRVEAGKAYLMASVCPTLLMVWLSINKKVNYHHIIIQLTLKIFVLYVCLVILSLKSMEEFLTLNRMLVGLSVGNQQRVFGGFWLVVESFTERILGIAIKRV